ncbi:NADAR family protein [Nostoc sp. PCC 9305]|uniref:NADAR family protein n=1 Tax=Nostoc sp. PCC 9305 TaxID=296636 RepID=UPI0039C6B092
MTIYFYSTREEYGCFSNFSSHGFELDGLYWSTSEHYFQAQKFVGTFHVEQIRLVKTPKDAARMGRERTRPLRQDWEQVKDDIMRQAVLCKFQTHRDIRDILLSTENAEIVENSPIDFYWGCGADGSGKNMLGNILMEVRNILHDRHSTDIDNKTPKSSCCYKCLP